jgi:2-amino-4-hydroxy-6-hydroxymethyldihydropteridine diphosphokinase
LKDLDDNLSVTIIGIGSNINPAENIQSALELLSKSVTISRLASIWQTPAVGSQGPDYLNSAILVNDPPQLDILKKDILSRIENSLGRIRIQDKNADRPMDLDVLIYRGECLDNDLWKQAHITIPAAELIPAFTNQTTGEALSDLSARFKKEVNFILRDDLEVSF